MQGGVYFTLTDNTIVGYQEWPLPNVWLGVTAENQARANERIPILLQIPAAVRFVSCEPLLGPVDLGNYFPEYDYRPTYDYYRAMYPDAGNKPVLIRPGIQWVVVGGETGPNARPMHPDWVRSLRDQCQEAGIPFFFKQWGEFAPITEKSVAERAYFGNREIVDPITGYYRRGITDIGCRNHVFRVGRKAAGRLLDGWTWDEFPNMEGVIDG